AKTHPDPQREPPRGPAEGRGRRSVSRGGGVPAKVYGGRPRDPLAGRGGGGHGGEPAPSVGRARGNRRRTGTGGGAVPRGRSSPRAGLDGGSLRGGNPGGAVVRPGCHRQ